MIIYYLDNMLTNLKNQVDLYDKSMASMNSKITKQDIRESNRSKLKFFSKSAQKSPKRDKLDMSNSLEGIDNPEELLAMLISRQEKAENSIISASNKIKSSVNESSIMTKQAKTQHSILSNVHLNKSFYLLRSKRLSQSVSNKDPVNKEELIGIHTCHKLAKAYNLSAESMYQSSKSPSSRRNTSIRSRKNDWRMNNILSEGSLVHKKKHTALEKFNTKLNKTKDLVYSFGDGK